MQKKSVIPHVDSRIRYFKIEYVVLEQMLSKSGFTWDDGKKMLQCEKQQYEDHYNIHLSPILLSLILYRIILSNG
jgi:hypothetical protein